jgi:hypothetical protein
MKHTMPTMGVGLRRLIGKRFPVVMMDEFRTSMLCRHCHHKLENYKECYRLLICRNCQSNESEIKTCCFFNRDVNACLNMMYLAREWLHNKTRPSPYGRSDPPVDNDPIALEKPLSILRPMGV